MRDSFKEHELHQTMEVLHDIILKSQHAQTKFKEGTSQHTLLKNRMDAMQISYKLIESRLGKTKDSGCSKEAVEKALPPVLSLLHKCEKAISKQHIASHQERRLQGMVEAMLVVKTLLEEALLSFV